MKHLLTVTFYLLPFAAAATPNWAQHVAPILYNNCATCHHPGGIAPSSLLTYNDAVAQAYPMSGQISSGAMPPWPPDHNYNALAHERRLSDADKQTLLDWISNGVPQGDLSLAPPVPVFSNSGMLPGVPTLSVQIPTYTSTASGTDVYRCFVMPSGQSADQFITAFEALPGNPAIVHHVLVFADTTGQCSALDAADPGVGYTSFGGVGTSDAIMLGAWVPGTAPAAYPASFGVKLPANADIVIQIHYPAGTMGMVDSTEIHFFLQSAAPGMREVYIVPALNHAYNINEPLSIAPNTTKWFHEQEAVNYNLSLIGIAPHMHLIGKSISSYAVTPAGDTDKFISIPEWDFHWQGFYMMKSLRKISIGSTIYADAFYDNTTNNYENPSNPPQWVNAGENTTNEMMLVYYIFSAYHPGDENIVIDDAAELAIGHAPLYAPQQLLQPYPIPASNSIIAKMHFSATATGTLELWNAGGARVWASGPRIFNAGYSTLEIPVLQLAAGHYFLKMNAGAKQQSQPVVIVR